MNGGEQRDLRQYRLVRVEHVQQLRVVWHARLDQLVQRQQLLERANQYLLAELGRERALLTQALHELALAHKAKDPAQYMRRWDNQHRQREHWGDE